MLAKIRIISLSLENQYIHTSHKHISQIFENVSASIFV